MALPASYSESTLGQYMAGVIGDFAGILGWSVVAGSYAEPINDALVAYPVATVAAATDLPRLRALARVMVWRAVVGQMASRYEFSTDNQTFKRDQLFRQAQLALVAAEADAPADALPGYRVAVRPVLSPHDPYAYVPSDERVLP